MSSRETAIPRFAQRIVSMWPSIVANGGSCHKTISRFNDFYCARLASENVLVSKLVNHFKFTLKNMMRSNHMNYSKARTRLRTGTGNCILAASGVAFWESEGISNDELKQTIKEFWKAFRTSGGSTNGARYRLHKDKNNPGDDNENDSGIDSDDDGESDDWQPIIIQDRFQVWRKSVPGTSLYRYKIFGTYDDIPARSFFRVQLDTDYRKTWDNLVIKLDVVDREYVDADKSADEKSYYDSKNEVVHWIMKYPFPMYPRDYCYIRRAVVDAKNNLMVLVSRAVDHPSCPVSKKYVRVNTYESNMVIKPHKSFDENGFDYLLTYSDDPQAAFPSVVYNWMASSGVPDFVKQLHSAAYNLTVRNRTIAKQVAASNNGQTTNPGNGSTTQPPNIPPTNSQSSGGQAQNASYVYG